jgi:hypothetical protein
MSREDGSILQVDDDKQGMDGARYLLYLEELYYSTLSVWTCRARADV